MKITESPKREKNLPKPTTSFMYPLLRSSSFFFFFLAIVFSSWELSTPFRIIKDEAKFRACSQQFNCGDITNITYPFWGGSRTQDCGPPQFKLECHNGTHTEIEIESRKFTIFEIRQREQTLTVVCKDIMDDGCPDRIPSIRVGDSDSHFECASSNANLTYFYNCSDGMIPSKIPPELRCDRNPEPGYKGFFEGKPHQRDPSCKSSIKVPIRGKDPWDSNRPMGKEAVKRGFDLRYRDVHAGTDCQECIDSAGQCGYNRTSEEFVCFSCPSSGHWGTVVFIEATAAAAAGTVILIVSICCLRKKFSSNDGSILFWKKQNQAQRNIESFLKHYGPLQARRYSYLDVKKMTNSFKEKLGQGGFGSVYKGKLHDSSPVAVKMLDESKANSDEFINEVAAISRTSHVNIVSLLGFCFEGGKRALIYEFMPNGSLEKFVFDENRTENSNDQLDWETYYRISLGIARGLEYLHRGCNTRILHFDIKPHNILLDEGFVPKISDFGLAKICGRKESLVSMAGPRGTIGYIAPEVFCRNFGGISHKSDVYSYGMMVLEMVGGRKNLNVRADYTSEIYFPQIYFPHWIYKRLELDEELGLKRISNEGDRVKVRKMIIVSLWCIQTDTSNRPPMSKVIEMLEGSLNSLQVPPKPFMSSPPISPKAEFSSTFESL